MSKTKLLLNIVEDIRNLAEDLQILADVIMQGESQEAKETYPLNEQMKEVPEPQPEEPNVSLEQVRGLLAKLAQAGRQEEIKALITKYGATRLSDVDPANFQALLKEVEGM